MTDHNNWNQKIIDEFRSAGGKLGGQFAGAPILLLTSTGAKTGQKHTTPMMYFADGDRLVVFASKAGAPTNPDWYRNLVAHPRASVEVATGTFEVQAEVAGREERDRLYAIQSERYPGFAEYQEKTTRVIPVVILSALRRERVTRPGEEYWSSRRTLTTLTSAWQVRSRLGPTRGSRSRTAS